MEMLGFWCQVSIKIRILLSIISGQSKSHDLAPIRLPTPTLWRRKLSISIWISMASDDWLPLEIRNGFAFASNCDLPPTWQWCHHHINHTPQLPRSMQLLPSDALDMTDFKVITMLLVFHMGESLSRHLYSWLIPSPIFSATLNISVANRFERFPKLPIFCWFILLASICQLSIKYRIFLFFPNLATAEIILILCFLQIVLIVFIPKWR